MLYPSPTSSQPSTTRFCLALGMGSHDPVTPNICHVAVVQGTNEQEETGHIDSGKKAQKEEQMAANMELRGEEKGGGRGEDRGSSTELQTADVAVYIREKARPTTKKDGSAKWKHKNHCCGNIYMVFLNPKPAKRLNYGK